MSTMFCNPVGASVAFRAMTPCASASAPAWNDLTPFARIAVLKDEADRLQQITQGALSRSLASQPELEPAPMTETERGIINLSARYFDDGNPIHTVLKNECGLVTADLLIDAYEFLGSVLATVKGEIAAIDETLSTRAQLALIFIVLSRNEIKLEDGSNGYQSTSLLSENIERRRFDCDELTFVVWALAQQLGLEVEPFWVHGHVFLRLPDGTYWDFGYDYDTEHYETHYKMRPQLLTRRGFQSILWLNRGLALQARNRWEESVTAFEKAREENPLIIPTLNALSESLEQLGRMTEALKVSHAAWTSHIPFKGEVGIQLALQLARGGQYLRALTVLREVAEEYPHLNDLVVAKLKEIINSPTPPKGEALEGMFALIRKLQNPK